MVLWCLTAWEYLVLKDMIPNIPGLIRGEDEQPGHGLEVPAADRSGLQHYAHQGETIFTHIFPQ